MNTNLGFIALLLSASILLSATTIAEGQIQPNKDIRQFNGTMTDIKINERWTAVVAGAIFVHDRYGGQSIPLWLEDGVDGLYGVSQIFFIDENILVGGGRRYPYSSPIVGIWDLSNPMPQVQRVKKTVNPSGMYHPQNWSISCPGEARKIFVNSKQRLVGVYNGDGWVTVYRLFESSPLQEIFVGQDITSIVSSEDFLVMHNGDTLQLYRYDGLSQRYGQVATYAYPATERNDIGLSFTDANRLYIVVQVGLHFEVLNVSVEDYDVVYRFALPQSATSNTGNSDLLAVDGEVAVIDSMIVHLTSGLLFGQIPQQPFKDEVGYELRASVIDAGTGFEVVSTEYKDNGTVGYITAFSEITPKVSKPAKVRRGAVEFLTIPGHNPDYVRVLQGGESHLAISASPGNRLYSIKEGGVNKIVKKEVGSVIYAVSNVQSDLEVSATFKKSKGMKEFSVYTPSQKTIGRPLPTGEKPWRWFTFLPAGTWVTYKVNPVDIWANIFTKIIVKPNGKVSMFPLVF